MSLEQRCPPNKVGLGFVNGKPTKAIYEICINLSLRLHMLNSHEWITSIKFSEIVQFLKASIIVICVLFKLSTLFVVSHVLNAKCPLNGG